MKRFRLTKLAPMIAGLLCGLLFATAAVPLGAQPASETRPAGGFGPAYNPAHEITLSGTIQQVVTKHAVGSPAGMHLLVAGPNGVVDAHVGPFLSKETKEALHTGTPVQIVGANVSLHGKSYLLARELSVGGSTITVRGKHGLLAPVPTRTHARTSRTSKSQPNGGAR